MSHLPTTMAAARALDALEWNTDTKKATVYMEPKLVVKATRKHKYDGRDKSETFVVTVGRPNFLEKRFVKAALKAKETFPVKRVQLKAWPVPRTKQKRKR